MSREIEVFGAAKVSENYLDKFFKKAGTVVKITPKKDRVIIKFNREDAAIRALELDGKIIEDYQIKVRLCQHIIDPCRKTETSFNCIEDYEEFTIHHIQMVQELIWASTMAQHRKITLSILFRMKTSEILFTQRTSENSEFNLFGSFLEYEFLKSEGSVSIKKTAEGGYVYFLSFKGKMITKDSQKIAAEKNKIHKEFYNKLKHISKRLYDLYTIVFEREALIKTVEEILQIQQEFEVPPFQGFVYKSICTIFLEGYQEYFKPNVMMLESGENFWRCIRLDGVLQFPSETKITEKQFIKLYTVDKNYIIGTEEIKVRDLCYVVEMNESLLEIQKLQNKIRDAQLYHQVLYSEAEKGVSILLLFDEQLPDQDALYSLIRNYNESIHYPLHLITLSSTPQMQKSVYFHFIKSTLEKSKDHYNTRKAQDLALEMIDSGFDELFGRTSSFEIGKDILSVQRDLPKHKRFK